MEPDRRTPYYAVIFTSQLTDEPEGYSEMAERMAQLAAEQPGYLGFESVREGSVGVTVSYWETEQAIAHWSEHPEHRAAQAEGRGRWYRSYTLEIARVGRSRVFDRKAER